MAFLTVCVTYIHHDNLILLGDGGACMKFIAIAEYASTVILRTGKEERGIKKIFMT